VLRVPAAPALERGPPGALPLPARALRLRPAVRPLPPPPAGGASPGLAWPGAPGRPGRVLPTARGGSVARLTAGARAGPGLGGFFWTRFTVLDVAPQCRRSVPRFRRRLQISAANS